MIRFIKALPVAFVIPLLALASCTDSDPVALDAPSAVDAAGKMMRGNGVSPVLPMRARTAGMVVGMGPAPDGRCPEGLPMLASFWGQGNATHMGKVVAEGSECLFMDPMDPSSLASGAGKYTITSANGDELYVAYDQTVAMPEGPGSPWILWSAELYATGGTGRFETAELVETVWSGGVNLLTNETWAEMDGGILFR